MKHLPRCIRQEELTKWKLIPAESKRQMKSAPGDDSFRKISSPSVVGRLYTLFSLMPFLFLIFFLEVRLPKILSEVRCPTEKC